MHPARILACSAGAVVVLVAVSACGSSRSKPPSVTSAASSTGASGSASPSASKSASPTPSSTAPKLVAKLPGNCDSLLPQPEIEDLLGVRFSGKTAYVVGIPEKNIGRLGNLNCRYGLGVSGKQTPALEIGISLYKSPAQADMRLTGTIEDYRSHGATQSAATVGGQEGTMLVGGSAGYNIPTLVVASDQRTVAVSMLPTVVAANKRGPAMVKVAALALDRTAP
ncbi:MAG TPA: hypothetical protein VH373_00515 [Jatrophihabitantaceae bacterium]